MPRTGPASTTGPTVVGMSGLRVVGAGLGRTGTLSLKLALERLLGGPCYHMLEVFARPEHVELWAAAHRGDLPDWDALFDGFVAGVDWPVGAYWEPLSEAFPDALILLSVRDPDSWWTSASNTIFEPFLGDDPRGGGADGDEDPLAMPREMLERRFTPDFRDPAAAKAAFSAHLAHVRTTAPPERLLEWRAGDGWSPICAALGLDVPEEPFPHVNSTEEFRGRARDSGSA